MKTKLLFTALAVALGFATSAQASLLDAKTVGYQYHYPSVSDDFPSAGNGNYLVGAGVEVTNIVVNVGTLDVSDTNLYVDFSGAGWFNSTSFNGFEIFDVFNNVDAFSAISVNAATNMTGFDLSRITFDDNHIWLNFQGLAFDANTIVSIDIDGGGSEVPEPASIALIGLGLLGAAASRRKPTK